MNMKRGFSTKRLSGVSASCLLMFLVGCVEDNGRVGTNTDTDSEQADAGDASGIVDPCRLAEELEYWKVEDFEFGVATQWWVSYDPTKPNFAEPDPEECSKMSRIAEDTCFVISRPQDVCEDTDNLPEDYCFVSHYPGREPAATELEEGRCGTSRYALRVVSENLKIYGGALGLNFWMDPHDVREWDGLSFWARTEEGKGQSLFVGVSEKYTDENNGKILFDDGEPFCLEVTDDDSEKCDRFGVGVGLGTEWRFFTIPFSEMKQRGYGMVAPELDVTAILGLNMGFETGDWDFWIDDVAFYREK